MADEPNQTTPPSGTEPGTIKPREMYPTHQDRQDPPSYKLPEKFKTVDDLVKAYSEAETKITEYGTKYKNYDDYAQIGPPDQIKQALDWARNVKAAMDRGELRHQAEATATKQLEQTPSTSSAPWDADDWAYKQPNEQSRAMFEYQQAETRKYIDGLAAQYGKQIDAFRQNDGREKRNPDEGPQGCHQKPRRRP